MPSRKGSTQQAKKKRRYIVEKKTGLVVDRYIGKRARGIVNPTKPILFGSWYQEYPIKDYRVYTTTKRVVFFKTKVK